jgi:type IV pilus assembly protein PilW
MTQTCAHADAASSRRLKQAGLSLVELLIAMALGVVLLLGLIQIFEGTRASFNAADARARIQESGRFALEFIRRDARMVGHMGCQNEYFHFPLTTPRTIEPTSDIPRGFIHSLINPGAGSVRDNAPYRTWIHRPLEIYDYTGTEPGDTYVIADTDPAPDGTAGNWAPTLPNAAAQLNNIAARALPGSDILVVRYFDENPITVATGTPAVAPNGTIQLGTAAPAVLRFGLYGMTDCSIGSLFQITSTQSSSSTTVQAGAGGLNVIRASSGGTDFYINDGLYGAYGEGTMMYRYQMAVYYIGAGANGPALMRQTIRQIPTTSAQSTQLDTAQELVEGVEMMQIIAGVDTSSPRDDFVDAYVSPTAHLGGAATPAALDDALRQISTLRISLLVRGNTARVGADRALQTIVVGDVNVTLPLRADGSDDGLARETYDTTIVIRNRNRS